MKLSAQRGCCRRLRGFGGGQEHFRLLLGGWRSHNPSLLKMPESCRDMACDIQNDEPLPGFTMSS